MNPTLSAFIICHGNAGFLRTSVASMAAQLQHPTAIRILVTDASQETLAAASELGREFSFPITASEQSLTCAGSKNFAASLTVTDAFFTLDADDCLEPGFVKNCLDHMKATAADVVGCDYWLQSVSGTRFRAGLPPVGEVAWVNPLPCCSLIRKSAYDRTAGFRNILYDDWAMWLELTRLGCRLRRVPEFLFTYVRHAGALTQPNKHDLAMQQLQATGLLDGPWGLLEIS